MIQSEILLFVLLVVVPSVHPQKYIDDVILQCRQECEQFAATEEKYIEKDPKPDDRNAIDLSGGNPADSQMLKLRKILYEKQKLQRPFECIANRLDPYSLKFVENNPHYQALVFQCKSQPQPQCDAPTIIYRTLDGTCNNLLDPTKGSVFRCLRRYTEANYVGVSGMRQSVRGKPLPGPRELSLFFNKDVNRPNQQVSQITAFFGQFVAHDMTDVPSICIGTSGPVCKRDNPDCHPECKPILIKNNDPFYGKFGKKEFPDSRTAICDTCTSLKKRIQTNMQSSYLDLSHVYGVLKSESDAIRTFDGTGKLKVQMTKYGREILPPSFEEVRRCGYAEKREYCFKSGDRRVNQHSPLTSMHTLYNSEHNRIAEELKRLNPHWDEEKIFQEARKIKIAQFQIVVYKEFLPTLLPPNIMEKYELGISDGYTSYDINKDATLFVEFNTAGFRLHTMVGSVISDFHGKGESKCLLRNQSFEVSPLYNGKWQSHMEGMSMTQSQNYDPFVVDDISSFMYKRPTSEFGYDIYALNIDRGRDNGLPTYTEMVYFLSFGQIKIQVFEDLEKLMERENIELLRRAYYDVRDIDLIVGLWNERVKPNSVLGETSAEIIGRQFSESKKGDRFYVEHQGNFNIEQLQSLRKATLSGVICCNTDIKSMQINAFNMPSIRNYFVKCENIEKVNLNLWKEEIQQSNQNFNWGLFQPVSTYSGADSPVPNQPMQFQQVPFQQNQFQSAPMGTGYVTPSQINEFQPVPILANQFQQVPFQAGKLETVPIQSDQIQQFPNAVNQYQMPTIQTNQFQQTPFQTNQFQQAEFQGGQFQEHPIQTNYFQPSPVQTNQFQQTPFQTNQFQPAEFQGGQFQEHPIQTNYFQPAPVQANQFQQIPFQTGQFQPAAIQTDPFQQYPYQTVQNRPEPIQANQFQSAPIQAGQFQQFLPQGSQYQWTPLQPGQFQQSMPQPA